MSEQNKETSYSAKSIQVLEGLEAVRKRPAMYIGDISERGLHHLVYEVVDNSIDEALAGYCKNILVDIWEDNSISVEDDGRGIPVDFHEKEKKSALEVVMTVLHAGGKFDKGTYKVSGGLHGVGVSCVNALSTKLVAEVCRGGKRYIQEYSCGKPLYAVKEVGTADKTGTKVTFHPDGSIFTETVYKYDILANRLRDLAYLNAGIRITLTDHRPDAEGNTRSDVFHSERGLGEFVEYLDSTREHLIPDVIHINTDKYGTPVEVAMTYNTSYNENIHSYVNNINTIEGGTHVTGFRMALTRTLKKYAEDSKMLEKAKVEINGDDFREGLTAVISVKVAEPQFEGQTKTKLGNDEVSGIVQQAVGEALTNYLEEHPKEARMIVDKVILAARARIAARKARDLVQRKSPMGGAGLPGKLADCSDKNPENCELFLVEGDSAGGTAKQGRNRMTQAILPLRGKILNVEKAMPHKVLESEEIKNIYTALGVTIGTEDDAKALNMEKINRRTTIILAVLTFFFGAWLLVLATAAAFQHILHLAFLFVTLPGIVVVVGGCWYYPRKMRKLRKGICTQCGYYGGLEFIGEEVIKKEKFIDYYTKDRFKGKEEVRNILGQKKGEVHVYTREHRKAEYERVYYYKIYRCHNCNELNKRPATYVTLINDMPD